VAAVEVEGRGDAPCDDLEDLGPVPNAGSGFPAMVLTHRAASDEDVDALPAAVVSAGGRITTEAAQAEHGYTGHMADPDGFLRKLTSAGRRG
jgi:predicted enzyme related to lactoylglutathione lyase